MPDAEKIADAGVSMAAGANNNSSGIGCSVASSSHLPRVEIMSASDEDLGYKLAQVKNVWDREDVINYEQGSVVCFVNSSCLYSLFLTHSEWSLEIIGLLRSMLFLYLHPSPWISTIKSGSSRLVMIAVFASPSLSSVGC